MTVTSRLTKAQLLALIEELITERTELGAELAAAPSWESLDIVQQNSVEYRNAYVELSSAWLVVRGRRLLPWWSR